MATAQPKPKLPSSVRGFRRGLRRWYKTNGRSFAWRRASASNYQKVIAEVLLQRTRAETVATFFKEFLSKYPSWTRLARASENELQKTLQPIGLWRQRASSLKRLAARIVELRRIPKDRETVESLPGVGQYIANAIMLLVNDEPAPLIDVNMARVLERYFGPRQLADIRYDPYLQGLAKRVVDCKDPKTINWSILDLGAMVCTISNPTCTACPLRNGCRYWCEAE